MLFAVDVTKFHVIKTGDDDGDDGDDKKTNNEQNTSSNQRQKHQWTSIAEVADLLLLKT